MMNQATKVSGGILYPVIYIPQISNDIEDILKVPEWLIFAIKPFMTYSVIHEEIIICSNSKHKIDMLKLTPKKHIIKCVQEQKHENSICFQHIILPDSSKWWERYNIRLNNEGAFILVDKPLCRGKK